ncbi:MAG: hypothetical protein PVJ89_09055 [Planctomycetota bacterium]
MGLLSRYSVVLWTLAFLAAGELALEVRASGRGFRTLLFGAPAASAPASDGALGRTPDFPFRSRVAPLERTPGVPRVWIASASYAEHIRLPAEQIWPVLVEDELEARGVEVEVLNASQAGWEMHYSVRTLDELGEAWDPDVVLVYQLSNDLDRVASALIGRPLAEGAGEEQVAEPAPPPSDLDPTELARRTSAYELTRARLGPLVSDLRPRYNGGRADLDGAAAARIEGRFRGVIERARELGAAPMLVSFATAHPDPGEDLPAEIAAGLKRANGLLSSEGWRRWVRLGDESMRRVAAAEGVPVLEVAEVLDGRSELFVDQYHFTPEGHRLFAARLADELEPRLRALEEAAR